MEFSIFSTDFKLHCYIFYINANGNVSTNTSSDNINIYWDNLSVVIVGSE